MDFLSDLGNDTEFIGFEVKRIGTVNVDCDLDQVMDLYCL